ncbi:MAG TPA: phosphatase PAP2 family protein, partial [Myxococcaceae bacterium]|nr:phosphatase PAP2 family protein [Myxococcaceae bacterium]
ELDTRLFGIQPSVGLEPFIRGPLTELLLLCYYSYYLLPLALGVLLYARGKRPAYHAYVLALTLFYALNFILYAAVPAVGPRFYLNFQAPLQGPWATPYLDAVMRSAAFTRDCFPSGHTGVTLIMLTFAFLHERRTFWALLPVGTGLVVATVACRFHYAVDLLCALPLAYLAVRSARWLSSPRAALARRGAWSIRWRQPARA